MAKARFNSKRVARQSKKLATMQVQSLQLGGVVGILTVDYTLMATLSRCIGLLAEFEARASEDDGPAFIRHSDMGSAQIAAANDSRLYLCRSPDLKEGFPIIEARRLGIVFLEALRLVPHLRSYSQQHELMPLLQALLDVRNDFLDVAADLRWFSGNDALPFICLSRWNLAVVALQSRISTSAFQRKAYSFYASVRDMVDGRVSKLRSLTHAPDKLSYLSVIDLFFHHERYPDVKDANTFFQHQRHKTHFSQIVQAVESLIAKLRKRKQLTFFDGVVVSIKYSEARGWYASAMLLFNYPERLANNISERVHEAATAIMEIWCLEISAVDGKGGSPIYPHASIHTPAFLCPSLPVINSQNGRLYFFSANASEPHENDALTGEQEKLKPIVDALDYLFLSQCFMRYKVDLERSESRMIRSYRL
ncbi:hypothetical protein [Aeromonas sp. AE23HZ002T15]